MLAKACSIKQHCVEYSRGSGDNKTIHKSKHAEKVEKRNERAANAPVPNQQPIAPPVINITMAAPPPPEGIVFPFSKEICILSAVAEPAPKRQRVQQSLDPWASTAKKNDQFLMEVTSAFAASNVPMSKLEKGSPLRQLLEKYMVVDGEKPRLVDPINLRGTWLPKVLKEGVRKLSDILREDRWFIAIGADETADPRSSNDYIVTVEVSPPFCIAADPLFPLF